MGKHLITVRHEKNHVKRMVSLMVMLFDPQSPTERRRAAKWSLVIACFVFVFKFAGFVLTGSTAIMSDALESVVNIAAAALLIYGIRVSDKPPDDDHPFGHGKVDFLVSSFEGGAIIVAALLIIYAAMGNWITGGGPHDLGGGLVIVTVASALNAGLGIYLLRVGRRTRSTPLVADGKHVLSDVWTSMGVIVGLFLVYLTGKMWIDSLVAILVALLILRTGGKLFHQAILGIMDTAEPAVVKQIEDILNHPQDSRVCSYHKLRHRLSGGCHYVDFHIQVPRTIDVETAHLIATGIEIQIAQILGHAGVMAHIEPCINPECRKCMGHVRGELVEP